MPRFGHVSTRNRNTGTKPHVILADHFDYYSSSYVTKMWPISISYRQTTSRDGVTTPANTMQHKP